VVKSNTFAIWRGGRPRDFELKLDYRITAGGNSGINYRSTVVPDPVTPDNTFAMKGYQCDIDGKKMYSGNNYEEKGRLFLAVRGQMTRVVGGRPPVVLSTFGDLSATVILWQENNGSIGIFAQPNGLNLQIVFSMSTGTGTWTLSGEPGQASGTLKVAHQ
jgi:hypothetical protein